MTSLYCTVSCIVYHLIRCSGCHSSVSLLWLMLVASFQILHCPSIVFQQALCISRALDSFQWIFSEESPRGRALPCLFLFKSHVISHPIKRSPDGLRQSPGGVAAQLIFFRITSVCFKPSATTSLFCLKESLFYWSLNIVHIVFRDGVVTKTINH